MSCHCGSPECTGDLVTIQLCDHHANQVRPALRRAAADGTSRWCPRCDEIKPLTAFAQRAQANGRVYPTAHCLACRAENTRRWMRRKAAERKPADAPAELKRCRKCGEEKPLATGFGTAARNGHGAQCKACLAEYFRQRRAQGLIKQTPRPPALWRASMAVRRARLKGLITRGPCELTDVGPCAGKTEAWWADLSDQLNVRWVCRRHRKVMDERYGRQKDNGDVT